MTNFTFNLTRHSKKRLSYGNEMISANDNMHHAVRFTLVRHLRTLAKETYPAPTIQPYSKDNPCEMIVDIKPPTRRRMDAPNWYPTIKALQDGLVDSGWLVDDNAQVVRKTSFLTSGLSGTKQYEINIEFQPLRKE